MDSSSFFLCPDHLGGTVHSSPVEIPGHLLFLAKRKETVSPHPIYPPPPSRWVDSPSGAQTIAFFLRPLWDCQRNYNSKEPWATLPPVPLVPRCLLSGKNTWDWSSYLGQPQGGVSSPAPR